MVFLPPNKPNIITRCIIIPCLLFIEYCIIGNAITAPDKYPVKALWFICIFIFLIIALLVYMLLDVVKLEGDETAKEITVSTLFSKRVIPTSQIGGYFMTIYKSSRSSVVKYGRILVLKDGKKIELFPGNITYIESIDQFMSDLHIHYLGEKEANYPFTKLFGSDM